MKNLLYILLFVPFALFGQTVEDFDYIPPTSDNTAYIIFPDGTLSDYAEGVMMVFASGAPVSVATPITETGSTGSVPIGSFDGYDLADPGEVLSFAILMNGESIVNIDVNPPLTYYPNSFDIFDYNQLTFTIDGNAVVFGCTGVSFVEFNLDANIDDGSCQTTAFFGCSDSTYLEYSSDVNVDDGSCITPKIYGCTDALYLEYVESANTDDGSCITLVVEGCTNSSACNYSSNANFDDNSCFYSDAYYDCDGNCYTDENGDCYYLSNIIDSINENYISSISSLQQALDTWNTTIDLSAGWNMIGYGCPTSIDLVEGLSNHTENILIVKDNNGEAYLPEWDFNGIGNLIPGFGYQIKLTEAIEGFSLCDWYVNDIPEDNIVSLQDYVIQLEDNLELLNTISTYEVGDFAEGGIVFYVDATGEHGLVAATEDLDQSYEWGCYGESVEIADDNYQIGTGLENTNAIVDQNCQTEDGGITAAQAALDAEINGYSDWYLPSRDELYQMYLNIGQGGLNANNNIGSFSSSYYWSSSESNNYAAWYVYFNPGYTSYYNKVNPDRVRVIRAF